MPMHRRVESIVTNRNAEALITVVPVAILVVVPVSFVAQQLLREIANGAVYLESELRSGIVVLGAPGPIIGPAITSTTLCLLQILKKRFNREK